MQVCRLSSQSSARLAMAYTPASRPAWQLITPQLIGRRGEPFVQRSNALLRGRAVRNMSG